MEYFSNAWKLLTKTAFSMGPYPFDFLIFKNAFGYKGLFRLSCLEEVLPSCPPWPLFLYLHGPLIFFFFSSFIYLSFWSVLPVGL